MANKKVLLIKEIEVINSFTISIVLYGQKKEIEKLLIRLLSR